MIFAAGLGSRLKPLTDSMPKALVPIAGRPMLEHVILKLKASGFTEIVINIHHFGEQILDFLKANDNFGLTIFMIEHHMDLVMEISDRIYVLDFGKPIAEGVPEEIQNNQRVIDAYLGGAADE